MPVGDTRALRWVLCSSPLFFPAQVLKQKLVESLPLHPFAHRSGKTFVHGDHLEEQNCVRKPQRRHHLIREITFLMQLVGSPGCPAAAQTTEKQSETTRKHRSTTVHLCCTERKKRVSSLANCPPKRAQQTSYNQITKEPRIKLEDLEEAAETKNLTYAGVIHPHRVQATSKLHQVSTGRDHHCVH